jgi:hypothetical protein
MKGKSFVLKSRKKKVTGTNLLMVSLLKELLTRLKLKLGKNSMIYITINTMNIIVLKIVALI